jgi:hypothetical protein
MKHKIALPPPIPTTVLFEKKFFCHVTKLVKLTGEICDKSCLRYMKLNKKGILHCQKYTRRT